VEFDTVPPEHFAELPDLPPRLAPMPEEFLAALGDAARTAAEQSTRFAVTRVQLRGKSGEVAATDDRQLLLQSGFPLPWQDSVLVPRLPVFGSRDLAFPGPVGLGRAEGHVILRAGDWTFFLGIDKDARFPRVEDASPGRPGRLGCGWT
jgi:hypothetical protein